MMHRGDSRPRLRLLGISAITVPWGTLLTSVVLIMARRRDFRWAPGRSRRREMAGSDETEERARSRSRAWWQGCQDLVDDLDIGGLYQVRTKSRLAGSLTIVLLTIASQCDQMHSLGTRVSA